MTPPDEPASWLREGEGVADTPIESNWLFELRKERFRSRASGKAHDFFVLRLADAVSVIATTPAGEVILVRQFRAGSARDGLEPPGGLLEPGEDPRVAGARELLEETGYAGDPAEPIGSAYSNPSLLTSKTHVIAIANARKVAEPKPDPNEELTVVAVPGAAITGMIARGEFDHALAMLALLWWLQARGSA